MRLGGVCTAINAALFAGAERFPPPVNIFCIPRFQECTEWCQSGTGGTVACGFELLTTSTERPHSLWCQPAITRAAVSAGFGWVTASLVYRRFVSLINIIVGSLTMV